jgi:hypothetical protein
MERDSRKAAEEEVFDWGPETIEAEIRGRTRGMIEAIVEARAGVGAGSREVAARRYNAHRLPPRRARTSTHHQSRREHDYAATRD